MNSVRKKAVLIPLTIVVLLPATTAVAAMRTDRSFGSNGEVRPGFFPSDVVATSDGGFVAVGRDHATGTVAVRRFTSTGASDATFGTNGLVTIPYEASDSLVALGPGGRIVVGLSKVTLSDDGYYVSYSDYAVVAMTETGEIDEGFGALGMTNIEAPYPLRRLYYPEFVTLDDLYVQPSGRIVFHGRTSPEDRSASSFVPDHQDVGVSFIAGITHEGALDATFGNEGYVVTGGSFGISGFSTYRVDKAAKTYTVAMVMDREGDLLVAGGGGDEPLRAARYTADGDLDFTYGQAGHAPFAFVGARDTSRQPQPPADPGRAPLQDISRTGVAALSLDGNDGLLIGGVMAGDPALVRLHESGRQDIGFRGGSFRSEGLAGVVTDLEPRAANLTVALFSDWRQDGDEDSWFALIDEHGEVRETMPPDAVRNVEVLADGSVLATTVDPDGRNALLVKWTDSIPDITLTSTAYLERGLHKVALSWRGTSEPVDVWRDDVLVARDVFGSAYTDHPDGRGRGAYRHKVCLSDAPGVCSAEVVTSFPDTSPQP